MNFTKRFLPLLLILSACATMAGMRKEPLDAGTARVFTADFSSALQATRRALAGAALVLDDIVYPDDHTRIFYAKRPSGSHTYGELVRVLVRVSDINEVTIRVLTKRRAAFNVTAEGDWSRILFKQIAFELGPVR